MKNIFFYIIFLLLIKVYVQPNASNLVKLVYIEKTKNVHVVDSNDRDTKITKGGRVSNVTLSPDKRTVAWLVLNTWIAEGDTDAESSKLAVYQNGKTRFVECGPFIRDYWFWQKGRQIATDCGGRHFAGTLTLYDTDTLLEIDSFFEPGIPEDKRPAWSKSSNSGESDTSQ